ncbi:unnamed protein product [Brassicogethes aeneus]|uniref:V-type proton ATPase subunit F n=1 Tax=Brassicogethes aeneus TaxID=1431903 RepID=A0A9P0FFP3_BRAAE|nr:unnamed protein product [Brassicogethes aeneus]
MHSKGHLIAVIADEDTCVGFLLGGIGEMNSKHEVNFFVVDQQTEDTVIHERFMSFFKRKDIDLILITYDVVDKIRDTVDKYRTNLIPAILEIPSKTREFDPNTDIVYQTAIKNVGTEGDKN